MMDFTPWEVFWIIIGLIMSSSSLSVGMYWTTVWIGRGVSAMLRRWREAREAEQAMGLGKLWPSCKHGIAKHVKCEECRKEAEEYFKDIQNYQAELRTVRNYAVQGNVGIGGNAAASTTNFTPGQITWISSGGSGGTYELCFKCGHSRQFHYHSQAKCTIGGCTCTLIF